MVVGGRQCQTVDAMGLAAERNGVINQARRAESATR